MKSFLGESYDSLGLATNVLCAIHCSLPILAPALLSVSGLEPLLGHEAEWGLTSLAILLAWFAANKGIKVHGSKTITAVFGVSALLLTAARFMEGFHLDSWGTALGVIGSLGLIAGHGANWRAVQSCPRCPS